LTRLARWGFIKVDASRVVRPTPHGLKAQAIWATLAAEIERRWRDRFGSDRIVTLRECLLEMIAGLDPALPDFLPIVGYGLCTRLPQRAATVVPVDGKSPLPALLAKPLLAFALEFEAGADVSLAITSNCLRLVGEDGVAPRDLPRLSGVSKEAIAMSLSFLENQGYALVGTGRGKLATLTPKGRRAREVGLARIAAIEESWGGRFGSETMAAVRRSLEELATEPLAESGLFAGLTEYRAGWRAKLPPPETLPQFPMILHRGGYPDGS
jgi:DNA-binding MarR family transcriptional regulator